MLGLVVSAHWVGRAQQTAGQPAPGSQGADDPRFTGKSVTMESKDLSIARRHFEAGARSAWHSHDRGQLLMVEEGRMRTQKRGQAMQGLGVGAGDYTAPGQVTGHGAVRCRAV